MKKILVAVAIAALTMGSMTAADARIGSSSSFSSRSSSSTFSRSSSSGISSGSSSRIGGSMGVSNSNVMAAARAQTQTSRSFGNVSANTSAAKSVTTTSQTTTTTRSNNYYNNGGVRSGGYYGGGSPGYYPHPGYGGGTVAAAAVGGALVGAAVAGGNHGTTIINNGVGGGVPVYGNGGAVYSNGGAVYAPAAVPVAPATTVYVEHHSGIWTFLGWVVAIVLVFFLVRWLISIMSSSTSNAIYEGPGDYASSSSSTTRTTRTTTTTVDPEEERAINKAKQLLGSAPQFYRQLQNANNRGDKDALRAMMTPQMFAEVEAGINERDGKPGQTTVKELRVVRDEVLQMRLEGDVYRGSIHFKGVVNEGDGQPDEAFDEVHHFYAEGVSAPWKLEGIESV